MANQIAFAIAFFALVCKDIGLVQCADECKTHADCKRRYYYSMFCCGGLFGDTKRNCRFSSCLYHYCLTESDCGSQSLCCRSNKCVNRGCSGCADDSDCYATHRCCKKTFPFNQTVCRKNCLNELCHSNDDCGGWNECCRSGKCVNSGCNDKCNSNSECNLGQYCCKKKKKHYWGGDSCSKGCVGEICSSDDDCGGPNECCISNKCVTAGCSGCNTTLDCSLGHYCCKKKEWYELSECSAHCIGKSCNRNDDCGGPGETCDSYNRCAIAKTTEQVAIAKTTEQVVEGEKEGKKVAERVAKKVPSWAIAVIVVSVVVLFIVVGVFVAVFLYGRKIRPANTTQGNRGAMALQNIRNQGAAIPNSQLRTQISTEHQRTGFQNQPPLYNDVVHSSQNPFYYPRQFPNTEQNTQNQARAEHNPSQYTPQQGNENHSIRNATEHDYEVTEHYYEVPPYSQHNQGKH